MKLGARRAPQSQIDSRFSRMLIVSAVLHVAIIGLILASAGRRSSSEPEKRPEVYTLEFTTPQAVQSQDPTKGVGRVEKSPPPAPRQATEEPPAKPKRIEPSVPVAKPRTIAKTETVVAKKPEPKKEAEPVKPKVILPEVAKSPVTPKPTETKTFKKVAETEKKDTPKLATGEKKLKEKPEEPKKVETKAEQKPSEVKPPKKDMEPTKKVTKEPTKVDGETDKKLAKKQTESVTEKPATKTEKTETTDEKSSEKTPQHKAEEEITAAAKRNTKILAAVEGIRTQQEAAQRDQEIAAALERVHARAHTQSTNDVSEKKEDRGGRDSGDAGSRPMNTLHGVEFLRYTEDIKQRVKAGWIVPEQKPGLTAIVSFGVESDGAVFDVELRKTSGDRTFLCQSALRAVKKANPLPPPPSAYQAEFATQKVEVTFGSEERAN